MRPKDFDELQRFRELLMLASRALLDLRDTVEVPPRPDGSPHSERWVVAMQDHHYQLGVCEGLELAALRLDEVHAGLYAALQQSRSQ